jgi:hypothetical protein
MIQVIVGVDDKAYRERSLLTYGSEEFLRCRRIFEGIDYEDAVTSNHESGIGARLL